MSDPESDALRNRHLAFGWCALLVFLTLGLFLEALNGFKLGWYLDVSNSTRRHMFTLAHAHGTLLAIVNIAFALSLRALPVGSARLRSIASRCLLAASVLLPAGFLLGGLIFYGGDPGLGILLVPVGGGLLLVAVALTARDAISKR